MRFNLYVFFTLVSFFFVHKISAQTQPHENAHERLVVLDTYFDSVAYAIGLNLGQNFAQEKININAGELYKGIKDTKVGNGLPKEEVRSLIMTFQSEHDKRKQGLLEEGYVSTVNMDSVSYAVGCDMGKKMVDQEMDLDAELIYNGLKDALIGEDAVKFTEENAQALIFRFQQDTKAKQEEILEKKGGKNQAIGTAFLEENKNKEGVIVLESGLQYKIFKNGSGPSPTLADEVSVQYTGRLIDGTKFDSSYDQDKPAEFPINRLIPGWQEILQLMKPGDHWEVYIPHNLAYGARGTGTQIGPYEVLIFEIELLEVIVADEDKISDRSQSVILDTYLDSISYAIGVNMGQDFIRKEVNINVEELYKGMKDSQSGNGLLTEDVQSLINAFEFEYKQREQGEREEGYISTVNIDSVSYAMGCDMGKGIIDNKLELNSTLIYNGFKDGKVGEEALILTEEEIETLIFRFQQDTKAKQEEILEKKAVENQAVGTAFLEENKNKEGVIVLRSGLQYKVIESGSGASPIWDDKVLVHYTGRLIDGTKFDSSYDRDAPAELPVNGLIQGWQEILQLMKTGDHWEVYIPHDLAYGEGGTGTQIGPYEVLVYEIELLKVLPFEAK